MLVRLRVIWRTPSIIDVGKLFWCRTTLDSIYWDRDRASVGLVGVTDCQRSPRSSSSRLAISLTLRCWGGNDRVTRSIICRIIEFSSDLVNLDFGGGILSFALKLCDRRVRVVRGIL